VSSVGTKRKLTTIMAADVVGYSRLVAADDAATVRRLHAMHDIIAPVVKRHDGRLFGEAGDSLMAEFPSAVEAVMCAMEIQEAVAERNADVPPETAMQFRIGIDIGEVIVEGDNLYGDGVNIAARLQEVADVGGIALSGAAHDQIKNKVSLDVISLGSRNLKNIPNPVPVFRVGTSPGMPSPAMHRGMGWRRRALAGAAGVMLLIAGFVGWDVWVGPNSQLRVFIAQAAQPVPTIPSIVVMPFLNASENGDQDYFCLGMAEDIITSLAKVKGLFVVGRDSALSFKGKSVQARQIGRELGVRYVLQGSVRRAENRVRISTYLVDAATEQTVWAARYDRELGDIFAIQDDISGKITQALSVNFRPGEPDRSREQIAQNFAAYDLFLRARELAYGPSLQRLLEARKLFMEVIALDPGFAGAYAGISITHAIAVRTGISPSPRDDVRSALSFAKEAAERDGSSTFVKAAMATALLVNGDAQSALGFAMDAQKAASGDAQINGTLAFISAFAGRPEIGIQPIQTAMDLQRVPRYRSQALFTRMLVQYTAGNFDDARRAFDEYSQLAEKGGGLPCQYFCLAYGAVTFHRVAEAEKDAKIKAEYENKAKQLADILRKDYPAFPFQFNAWTNLFAKNDQGFQARDTFRKDLTTLGVIKGS
jgi:adenylate cyclase